jgi:hypothetical protein
VLYWCLAAAVAVLSDYLAITGITPAAFATGRSICRKSKKPPVASGSAPQNYAFSLVVGPTFANQCQQSPNGCAAEPVNAFRNQIDIVPSSEFMDSL